MLYVLVDNSAQNLSCIVSDASSSAYMSEIALEKYSFAWGLLI